MKDKNDTLIRPTFEESEIKERIYWFITLRWFAIVGVIGALLFSTKILKINLPVFYLSLTTLLLLLCNILFFIYAKFYFQKRINSVGIGVSTKFANIQIASDLFILTLLLHFSGGVENPFSFYFIFHILIASILLSTKDAYYQATLAIFLFSGMVLLEYLEIIPHYSIEKLIKQSLYNNGYYCFSIIFVFSTTMYLSVYMATSITRKLRKRQKEIILLKEEVEKRNKELQETQSSLIQSEKLAAIGRLATGIAHQINNPLTTILTFSQLSLRKVENDNLKEKLETIVQETTRCRNIIRSLLNFAGKSEPKKELCNINRLIENAISIIASQAQANMIKIFKELEDNIPDIYVDSNQIMEVFINIMINAIDSMPKGGALEIVSRLTENKKFVSIEFIDTGCGIKKDDLEKIFDPFFTTKEKGTGMGLAIAYGIIQEHKGIIFAESEEGYGTKFIIKLPIERGGETNMPT